MATIQEVAKLANVSVATAYKVFSDTYTTEAQNTQRVLQAAKILGYVPKKKERHPSRDYKLIALLFSEASNEFNTSLIRTLNLDEEDVSQIVYEVVNAKAAKPEYKGKRAPIPLQGKKAHKTSGES